MISHRISGSEGRGSCRGPTENAGFSIPQRAALQRPGSGPWCFDGFGHQFCFLVQFPPQEMGISLCHGDVGMTQQPLHFIDADFVIDQDTGIGVPEIMNSHVFQPFRPDDLVPGRIEAVVFRSGARIGENISLRLVRCAQADGFSAHFHKGIKGFRAQEDLARAAAFRHGDCPDALLRVDVRPSCVPQLSNSRPGQQQRLDRKIQIGMGALLAAGQQSSDFRIRQEFLSVIANWQFSDINFHMKLILKIAPDIGQLYDVHQKIDMLVDCRVFQTFLDLLVAPIVHFSGCDIIEAKFSERTCNMF